MDTGRCESIARLHGRADPLPGPAIYGDRVPVIPGNPATRYHSILKRVREGNKQVALIDAWAKALEVDPGDPHELARRMAATASLLSDIHDHLAALSPDEVDPQDFRRHFVAWARPLLVRDVQATAVPWKPDQIITQDALSALASLGYLLAALRVEPQVDRASIDEILPRFDELLKLVTGTDELDRDLRAFLVRHLTTITERLRLVRIYGRPGIDEAIGRFMVEGAQVEQEARREPTSRLARFVQSETYQAARTLLDDLLKAMGIATGAMALGQGFGLFMLPSASPTPAGSTPSLSNDAPGGTSANDPEG